MILIGYARVSTINQNEDRQIQELIKYGVEEKRIYIDKQSGKDFHRPSYMKMLKRLKKKDDEYWLTSDNPEYQAVRPNSHYRIMGVVVRVVRDIPF